MDKPKFNARQKEFLLAVYRGKDVSIGHSDLTSSEKQDLSGWEHAGWWAKGGWPTPYLRDGHFTEEGIRVCRKVAGEPADEVEVQRTFRKMRMVALQRRKEMFEQTRQRTERQLYYNLRRDVDVNHEKETIKSCDQFIAELERMISNVDWGLE